jgi:glutathionylspermidine synthase
MRRILCSPRKGWQQKVEELGLAWHSAGGAYWNESAYYEFSAKEVDVIEAATNELHGMCLQAVQQVIDDRLYATMGIPEMAVPLIERSWEEEPPSLYGRFDFAYDGWNPPKLLEYNADTPTALLEAAVVQWYWLQDAFPRKDQFNSLHERIIALWKELKPYLPGGHVDFCSVDDVEDGITVTYLQDTANQAGLSTSIYPINEVGWNGSRFVDPRNRPIRAIFKLYPWEWMIHEEFGEHLEQARETIWMEPPWKMVLSNKGILAVLWNMFPRHPNLLEARFDDPGLLQSWVRKPKLSREGANVTVHRAGTDMETPGDYGEEGYVYQELAALRDFSGCYPVLGSWTIGHEPGSVACGMGIRESRELVTTNTSQFVPHLFG